jgi:hypothetical protein
LFNFRAGVDVRFVSSQGSLAQIADQLDISIDWLLGRCELGKNVTHQYRCALLDGE